jgi:hypothetical protein
MHQGKVFLRRVRACVYLSEVIDVIFLIMCNNFQLNVYSAVCNVCCSGYENSKCVFPPIQTGTCFPTECIKLKYVILLYTVTG